MSAALSNISTFRAWYQSTRRHIDASSIHWEFSKTPRMILDRVTCHPSQVEKVSSIIFETNPWAGFVESGDHVPRDEVWVSFFTVTRQQRFEKFRLGE
jgi:hypothetical protein